MKKILIMLMIIIVIFTLTIQTVFAKALITGKDKVYAGEMYTYSTEVNFTGVDIVGNLTGIDRLKVFDVSAKGLENESLSVKASINIQIPEDAKAGDTFVIHVYGQYATMDENYNPCDNYFDDIDNMHVPDKTSKTEIKPEDEIKPDIKQETINNTKILIYIINLLKLLTQF